jgi:hypothetical protein
VPDGSSAKTVRTIFLIPNAGRSPFAWLMLAAPGGGANVGCAFGLFRLKEGFCWKVERESLATRMLMLE